MTARGLAILFVPFVAFCRGLVRSRRESRVPFSCFRFWKIMEGKTSVTGPSWTGCPVQLLLNRECGRVFHP